MEPIVNSFFLMSSVILTVALAIIWAIPSGPTCPDCNGNLTEKFKLAAVRKSDNKSVHLEWVGCYKCKTKFDRKIDGIKKNSFMEVDDG